MRTLNNIKLVNAIGGISCLSFLTLGLIAANPPIIDGANAEEVSTALNIEMQPVVSVGIDKAVNLSFTPSSAGEFQNASTKLTVSTNQTNGYQILMSTEGNSADITNIDTAGTIKSIVGNNVAAANFPNNSWGYSINLANENASSYNAVPNVATQIRHIAAGEVTAGQADEYHLNFGAKVNNALPAGNYNKLITISVVANPVDANNLQHLTYMQDMTSDICANTRGTDGSATVTPGNEPSKQLIDIRDGKKYWVSKLADQNCWMVQNLDLDITQTMINDGSLNSSNTDLGAGQVWGKDGLADSGGNLISNYAAVPTEKGIPISDPTMLDPAGWAATKSWDLGQYILLDPQNTNGCSGVSAAAGVASCNRVQLVNENTNYDSHYLIGNRYQYNTATAGTAGEAIDIEAPNSICAKGWKLPSSKSTTRSFTNLINSYTQDYLEHNPTPFYFVGAGNINTYSGYLDGIGSYGNYWSSTVGSDKQYAEYLLTTGTVTGVVYNDGRRYFGISIRCEAR